MSSGEMSSMYRSAISAVSMWRSHTKASLVALDGLSLPASIRPFSHEGTKSRRRTLGATFATRLRSSSSRHFCCTARASVSVHVSTRRASFLRPVRGQVARTLISYLFFATCTMPRYFVCVLAMFISRHRTRHQPTERSCPRPHEPIKRFSTE